VVGELACGNLRARAEVLGLFASLPTIPVSQHHEVLAFVESRALMGRGLGWIDVHLLASATRASVPLWTADKRLAAVALELGVGRASE
jgi:predicted nucleic acid-binding protein